MVTGHGKQEDPWRAEIGINNCSMIHCLEKSEVHIETSMEMQQIGQSIGTGTQEKRNVMISNNEEIRKLAKSNDVEEVVAAGDNCPMI